MAFAWKASHGHVATLLEAHWLTHWSIHWTDKNKHVRKGCSWSKVVGCLMPVSWLSHDCLMTVSWLSHDCLMAVWQLSGNFLETFWQLSGKILATFWKLSGNFLKTFWKLSGNLLATFPGPKHERPVKKASRELQKAALRTSHQLLKCQVVFTKICL